MKLLWVDAETGGLIPSQTEMTELSGIVDIDGKAVEEFQFLLRPSDPAKMNPQALMIQGRKLEDVMAHPLTQAEGYRKFMGILSKYVNKYDKMDKFVWAGQNPKFDMDFTRAMWTANNDKYFGSWFHNTPVDLGTLVVAMNIRGQLPTLVNNKLETIAQALGRLKGYQTHKAIDDIRLTRDCFYDLASRIPLPTPADSVKFVEAGHE